MKDVIPIPQDKITFIIDPPQKPYISDTGMLIQTVTDLGEEMTRATVNAALVREYIRRDVMGLPVNAIPSANDLVYTIQKAYRDKGIKGHLLELFWFNGAAGRNNRAVPFSCQAKRGNNGQVE